MGKNFLGGLMDILVYGVNFVYDYRSCAWCNLCSLIASSLNTAWYALHKARTGENGVFKGDEVCERC